MTLQTLAERLKRNVVVVDDLAGAVESYLLTLGFRVAAWVAVVPTLILTSRTIQQVAGMDAGAAMASSVALELVGQATVNQWIREADWNRDKAKSEASGRARFLFGAMCVYFAADFVFVGILEVPKALGGAWAHLAMLIFPLMQVISTFVMVERVAQTRREAAADAAKVERIALRAERARVRQDAEEAARNTREFQSDTPTSRQSAPTRAELEIRLDKRSFRREIARLNGELAPLADALREPGANRANVLNAWLQSRGFERVPEGTARGWVPVVLETAMQREESEACDETGNA